MTNALTRSSALVEATVFCHGGCRSEEGHAMTMKEAVQRRWWNPARADRG